jgi:hypothetical protein
MNVHIQEVAVEVGVKASGKNSCVRMVGQTGRSRGSIG